VIVEESVTAEGRGNRFEGRKREEEKGKKRTK
jgi:hypothetical protein